MDSKMEKASKEGSNTPPQRDIELALNKSLKKVEQKNKALKNCKDQLTETKRKAKVFEKELNRLESSCQSLSAESKQIKADNAALGKSSEKVFKEKEVLQVSYKKLKNESAKQLMDLESKNKRLQEKIDELEKIISEKNMSSIDTTNDLTSPKSTFKIHMYRGEKQYNGKIEHLYSKSKRAFQGLDHETIVSFIDEHLPKSKEDRRIILDDTIDEKKNYLKPSKESKKAVQLNQFSALMFDTEKPVNAIDQKLPFKMIFTIKFADVNLIKDPSLEYTISVYAKPLHGGERRFICKLTDIRDPTATIITNVLPGLLSTGDYRLEATLTTKSQTGKFTPVSAFKDGGLLHVY